MKIERTCRVELSAAEVLAAITAYLHEKHRYSYGRDALKLTEEALSFVTTSQSSNVVVNWGEPPEPPEEPAVLLPESPSVDESLAVTIESASV